MTLQELHEKLGNILTERPELANNIVVDVEDEPVQLVVAIFLNDTVAGSITIDRYDDVSTDLAEEVWVL